MRKQSSNNSHYNKRVKRHRGLKAVLCAAFLCLTAAFMSVMVLKSKSYLFDDPPPINEFPCRGAYVSEKTGEINWERFNEKYISFVYIRATRGTAFADKSSSDNIKGAKRSGIPFGVVHDFDFGSSGKLQADNFIKVIKGCSLIPAVDIRQSVIERIFSNDERASEELAKFIGIVKKSSGGKILLITDKSSYETFGPLTEDCLILAFDSETENYCKWDILAYSEDGRSEGLTDKKRRYTMLSAQKGVSLEQLLNEMSLKN